MSEQKFKGTPGPWGVYVNGPHVLIEGDGDIIAGMWNHNVADATLMAASKDLLEALQAVLAGTSWHRIEHNALDAARAAIAKALGDE